MAQVSVTDWPSGTLAGFSGSTSLGAASAGGEGARGCDGSFMFSLALERLVPTLLVTLTS